MADEPCLADTTNASIHDKIVHAKPADLVDACFTNNGTVKIAELQVFQGATALQSALSVAFIATDGGGRTA